MFIPNNNLIADQQEIFRFMRENPFAIIVSNNNGEVIATHTPVELESDQEGRAIIRTHIAKANPQWKTFTEATTLLVIFNGPHTYISSSWYDHVNVPTWNYIAIHVYGKPKILDRNATIQVLQNLVSRHEASSEKPFSMASLDDAYLDSHLKALVAFEITIDKIDAKAKLSQNRNEHNYNLIINELDHRPDEQSHAVKQEMERIKTDLFNK